MVVLTNGGRLGHPDSFCFYCGRSVQHVKQIPGTRPPKDARTVDHIVPQCRGGKRGPLVTACLGCNEDKHALTLDEYRVVVALRAGAIQVARIPICSRELTISRGFSKVVSGGPLLTPTRHPLVSPRSRKCQTPLRGRNHNQCQN